MIASCALAFRESGRIKILDLGVATLSLAAIATTGTRGILAPSILVVLCALYWGVKNTNLSRKGKAAATSLVLLTLLAGTLSVAYDRIGQTVDDLERMQAGDLGGSIGLRFQFWKGAAVMASESPFLGIGNRHFEEFQDLKEHDVVDRQALDYAPYHYHNQFLDNLVKGAFGAPAPARNTGNSRCNVTEKRFRQLVEGAGHRIDSVHDCCCKPYRRAAEPPTRYFHLLYSDFLLTADAKVLGGLADPTITHKQACQRAQLSLKTRPSFSRTARLSLSSFCQ